MTAPVALATAAGELERALATYDRAALAPRLAAADARRADIQQRFPIADWPTLPLERYALGQADSEDTYCRWLEFRSTELGSISGGSAMKLVIFKRKSGPGWYYPEARFGSLDEAWTTLRGSFVEAFRLADAGQWDVIDTLPGLDQGPALCTKTLHVYYPAGVLPIYSRDHLLYYLQIFGRPDTEHAQLARVALNRALLDAVRAHPGLSGWTPTEVAFFLYDAFHPREQQRVVKIAPGENAKFWADCRDNGYICVGWDDVGDLRAFASKAEFRARFTEAYGAMYRGNKAKISAKANEVWTLRELEPGDLVVANQGTAKVLALGEVQDPAYEWRDDRGEFRHTVRVAWDTSVARSIPAQPSWATVTVGKVPPALYQSLITPSAPDGGDRRSGVGGDGPVVRLTPLDPEFAEISAALERKGQTILYGPPGTGKTYTARRFTVAWLLQRRGHADPGAALADAAQFAAAERDLSIGAPRARVWWVVANPSEWQWDRLTAEGRVEYRHGRLEPNYPRVRVGDLVIGYQTAPDSRVVAIARVSKPLHTNPSGELKIELTAVAPVIDGPTYQELASDPILGASEPMRHRCQGTLFALTAAEVDRLVARLTARDLEIAPHLDLERHVAPLTRLTFHPSYAYEDFIEGYRPYDNGSGSLALRLEEGVFKRVCAAAAAHPDRDYVVLVDEINRANLAKVFGEVVALLERDKRGLVITLPQSKRPFAVPANVYLVGTMNTADRSIKLLDAAIRRRFAFFELMPDASLLRGAMVGALGLDDFLAELNRRVAGQAGREKQIGHSYLLEVDTPVTEPEEFARRFRQEILPLLQEYCYEDYGALAEYLGGEIVDRDAGALDADVVGDPMSLIAALEREFVATGPSLRTTGS